jgi:hypothetical protein
MGLASQFRNLQERGAKTRRQIFGAIIVITDLSGNKHSFTASVFQGPGGGVVGVSGGYYETNEMSVELIVSDLAGFVPEPGMLVTARGENLRIAPDGVTPGKTVTRLRLIPATAPSTR